MKRLRACPSGHYTLLDACPRCQAETHSAHPPKYSPHDKYADIRRREKHG
ncbi:MAG: nucleolar RNA-binding Nop10p family protein [Candidatus Micrarchaeota archaeon]|nr:nucleolar RNA-binding Nop10p family protein [Candidatus Micrarchaeota archaeon]